VFDVSSTLATSPKSESKVEHNPSKEVLSHGINEAKHLSVATDLKEEVHIFEVKSALARQCAGCSWCLLNTLAFLPR
jgi:hypothetical protein